MTDLAAIRTLLNRDRPWSLYALGDLDPRRAGFCDWYVRGTSVALLYREFDTPILFAAGAPEVLADLPEVDACLLQVPEIFLDAVARRFELDWTCPMLRMALDPRQFVRPDGVRLVEPLRACDEDALRELYAEGCEGGEAPDFFHTSQLGDDTFFGVREDGRLVAAGGTHLYSATESVGAIGNVYTHRSQRGRGCAAAVMTAIVERLIACGTETVGLNVRAANAGAIRLYQRLGFRIHARFWEGRATRQQARS